MNVKVLTYIQCLLTFFFDVTSFFRTAVASKFLLKNLKIISRLSYEGSLPVVCPSNGFILRDI